MNNEHKAERNPWRILAFFFLGIAVVLLAVLFWQQYKTSRLEASAAASEKEAKQQKEKQEETKQELEELKKELETLTEERKLAKVKEKELEEAAAVPEAEEAIHDGELLKPQGESLFSQKDNGYVVAIDAGHTGTGYDGIMEPIGPGAAETKARDTGGTEGVSGYPEYALNLEMALQLREELVSRGYTVYLTRETNDIRIGNIERANVANENEADVYLRIHANSDSDSSVYGALTMATSESNPYVSAELSRENQNFSQILIDAFCEATGAYNRGIIITDSMSGLNWSQVPCSIIEMGFMSNPEEDAKMQTKEYQEQMTQGMANGIDRYFGL